MMPANEELLKVYKNTQIYSQPLSLSLSVYIYVGYIYIYIYGVLR